MKSLLVLIYGPNGAGKSTISRALATKYNGLHIQLDDSSSMMRGKFWHTRKNNKDKMMLVLGVLNSALQTTKYRKFFIDGVLIYRFMFKLFEKWCRDNNVDFSPVYLTGNCNDLNFRVKRRRVLKKNWNDSLPEFYEKFSHKSIPKINSSKKTTERVFYEIQSLLKRGGKL